MSIQRHHSRRAVPAFGASFWTGLAEEVLITLAHSVVLFTGLGITLYALDPARTSKSASEKQRKSVIKKMKSNNRIPFEMSDYEAVIALELVYPRDIHTSFSDIGGLEKIKKEIQDIVCLPLQRLDLFSGKSELIRPPKGILLFGPPGTGKTMMAKAIAKESSAAFINLKVSTLLNKWFGESEKLVRATFTLAWKLSPCIIFIDELESFLRKRGETSEHQAVSNMKAEFMSLWDGLNTNLFVQPKKTFTFMEKVTNLFFSKPDKSVQSKDKSEQKLIEARKKMFGVVVIGATNRPGDIDEAVLRRMARTFCLDLPSSIQRHSILKLILQNEELSTDLSTNLLALAESLEGFSGSDIKELCRAAAVIPLRELAQQEGKITSIRKLRMSDFIDARQKVFATGFVANQYQQKVNSKQQPQQPFNPQALAAMQAMFLAMTQPKQS